MRDDFPADSSTSAVLRPYGSFAGEIETLGDRDWFRLEMREGQRVFVTANGDRYFDGVEDTVIRVLDSRGRELAFNDDVQSDGFSQYPLTAGLRFIAPSAGTYYVEVAAYDDADTGRYFFHSAGAAPVSPLETIDWGTQVRGRTIDVYFAAPGERFDGYTSEGFTAYERARFQAAFETIEAVTNLQFNVVSQSRGADFRLVLDLDEDLGNTLAYFNPPGETNAGVGVFNGAWADRSPGGVFETGGEGFAVLVHELLHGLGLAHPHDDGGLSEVMDGVYEEFDDYGAHNLNQGIFTAMSYNEGFNTGTEGSGPPQSGLWGNETGPMALDIAVLQEKYGANTTTGAGDTTYVLPGANRAGTGWQAIWDVTGADEIRAAPGTTRDVTISLRQATLEEEIGGGGFYSGAEGIAGGFTVAAGVVIEHATGGAGDDSLYDNGHGNRLSGLGGDDRFYFTGGSDTLEGGAGYDRLTVNFAMEDIRSVDQSPATGGRTFVTVARETDTHTLELSGIEWITLRGGGVTMSDLAAMRTGTGTRFDGDGALLGSALNDTLAGGAGRDVLDGGAGADLMVGRAGNDFYLVDNPLDVVREDATFSAGGGIDTIRAFVDYIQPDNVELLRLGNLDDVLHLDGTGNDAPGTLVGNAGRNVLTGRGGNDQINGNDGSDVLIGNTGGDTLVGGLGSDRFVFTAVADSRVGAGSRDLINDFERGYDKIDLRGIDADTTSFGTDDAFRFIGRTAFSERAGELRVQDLGEGVQALLLEADVNGDGAADMQIFVNQRIYMFDSDFLL